MSVNLQLHLRILIQVLAVDERQEKEAKVPRRIKESIAEVFQQA